MRQDAGPDRRARIGQAHPLQGFGIFRRDRWCNSFRWSAVSRRLLLLFQEAGVESATPGSTDG